MNPAAVPQAPPDAGWNWKCAWPDVLALAIGLVAINSQSFWIDETMTAKIASQATISEWWRTLSSWIGSDTQMPGYMFYIWLWVKIFGCSEWGLRASNLPWVVLGFLAIPRRQVYYLLALAASPFLWFYLNEARPYTMQISASLILLGSLWRLLELPSGLNLDDRREKILAGCFCFGLVALSGSSLLGMIWAGAGLGAALAAVGWQRTLPLARRCLPLIIATGLVLGSLALYYLWSVKHGNHASPASTGVGNVLFVSYELAGLAGLGPGRIDIHGAGLKAFWPFLAPLAVDALVIAAVLFAGCRIVLKKIPRHVWLGALIALGTAVLCLLAAGVMKHFSVLGRHFTPLAPCIFLLVASGLKNFHERGGWRRLLGVSFLLLCLASALSLRFCERHAKDDYRTAAAIAIRTNAGGGRVWWCADGTAGFYYGVPLSQPWSADAAPGQVWLVANPLEAWMTNKPAPDMVLFSKPELHDPQGFVRTFLQRNHYQQIKSLPAFTLWRKN